MIIVSEKLLKNVYEKELQNQTLIEFRAEKVIKKCDKLQVKWETHGSFA